MRCSNCGTDDNIRNECDDCSARLCDDCLWTCTGCEAKLCQTCKEEHESQHAYEAQEG